MWITPHWNIEELLLFDEPLCQTHAFLESELASTDYKKLRKVFNFSKEPITEEEKDYLKGLSKEKIANDLSLICDQLISFVERDMNRFLFSEDLTDKESFRNYIHRRISTRMLTYDTEKFNFLQIVYKGNKGVFKLFYEEIINKCMTKMTKSFEICINKVNQSPKKKIFFKKGFPSRLPFIK